MPRFIRRMRHHSRGRKANRYSSKRRGLRFVPTSLLRIAFWASVAISICVLVFLVLPADQAANSAAEQYNTLSVANTNSAVSKDKFSNFSEDFVLATKAQDENSTESQSAGNNATSSTSNIDFTNPNGEAMVEYAKQFVGCHYRWGGDVMGCRNWHDSKGVDCSGFVKAILVQFGYKNVPRYSQSFKNYGVAVDIKDIQTGDIVVYEGHVAMYAGNGKIVEAQSARAGVTDNRDLINNKQPTAIRRVVGN